MTPDISDIMPVEVAETVKKMIVGSSLSFKERVTRINDFLEGYAVDCHVEIGSWNSDWYFVSRGDGCIPKGETRVFHH